MSEEKLSMKKNELHLHVDKDRWIYCMGDKHNKEISYPYGFTLKLKTFLGMLEYIDHIKITVTQILFCRPNDLYFAVPNTPHTFKESRQIMNKYSHLVGSYTYPF